MKHAFPNFTKKISMRPILASQDSFNYQAAVWLNNILSPLLKHSSALKDTFSFVKLISTIPQLKQTE